VPGLVSFVRAMKGRNGYLNEAGINGIIINFTNYVLFTSLEHTLHLYGIQEAVSSILSTSTRFY